MEAEKYVESVAKLSVLAADVLSRYPWSFMEECSGLSNCAGSSKSYRLRKDISALPLSVSEALLNSFRQNQGRHNIFITPKLLGFFFDSTRTPLFNLNLTGSMVSDQTLLCLLASHSRNLLYLDVTDCMALTEELNELSRRIVPLNRLRILNLGNLVKIFSPWLRAGRDDIRLLENVIREDDEDEENWKTLKGMGLYVSETGNGIFDLFGDCDVRKCKEMKSDGAGPSGHRGSVELNAGTSYRWHNSQVTDGSSSSSICDFVANPPGHCGRLSTLTTCRKRRKEDPMSRDEKRIFTWCFPNLQALVLHGDQLDDSFPEATESVVAEFFLFLLRYNKYLIYLDLSYWSKMGDLRFLRPHQSLHTLILYDVPDLYNAVHVIRNLTSLRHLDVSQSDRDTGQYPCPVTTLNLLVTSLPHLTSLDITSTNLASNPTKGDFFKPKCSLVESDIDGLKSLPKPLQYLGIFYCDAAAHYRRIPAVQVAGDGNESQVLLALERYIKRPALLLKVLNEAYQVYRFGTPGQCSKGLQLILDAMAGHVEDTSIQIAASACVFYIIRNCTMNAAIRKRVISALLTGLEEHSTEHTMVRNCCLSLCHFEIPNDVQFEYEKTVKLLLGVLDDFQDQMIQRIVVFLLNSMACHVEGEYKMAVGQLNAVERMLTVIRRRYAAEICDDVMELAWSFLWNITDETPANCDRFLCNGGMELFQECYRKFTGKRKLLRNMTGLMGNIAEVKEMRGRLMQADYIAVFCNLLKNMSDGIEISYNSAGVLSHLLSDGPSTWAVLDPSRELVSDAVIQAVERWHVSSRRFINYRSFVPILRLVPLSDCPACQHWAVWALANLTSIDAKKYCPYVIHEGGLPLLEGVAACDRSSQRIRKLATMVISNIGKWAEESGVKVNNAGKYRSSLSI